MLKVNFRRIWMNKMKQKHTQHTPRDNKIVLSSWDVFVLQCDWKRVWLTTGPVYKYWSIIIISSNILIARKKINVFYYINKVKWIEASFLLKWMFNNITGLLMCIIHKKVEKIKVIGVHEFVVESQEIKALREWRR